MIKKIITRTIIIIITIIIVAVISNYNRKRIVLSDNFDDYKLVIKNDEIDIKTSLSKNESKKLYDLFNNKKYYKDNPSCGFDEDFMFDFGNIKLLIAYDGDPFFELGEQKEFIKISKKEMEWIIELVEKYGGKIPFY